MKWSSVFSKEISRVFRKPSVFLVLILAPFLVAGLGIAMYSNYGLENMKLGFVNLNKDPIGGFTVRLILSFFHGGSVVELSKSNYLEALMKGEVHAVIIIPEDFTDLIYSRKQSYLWFVPSPYDLQIAAGIYTVIKSLFDDLEGSMFFDPKVLRYMFVGKGYPSPDLVVKYGKRALNFDSLLAPAVVFLSGVLVVLTLSSLSVVEDRERRLHHMYRIAELSSLGYTYSYVLSYTILGVMESSIAYFIFHWLTGTSLSTTHLVILVILSNLFHALVGFSISAISPNKGVALILMTTVLGMVFFSSGTLVPLISVPEALRKFITGTVIYNTTLIVRKAQIFGDVNLGPEYLKIVVSILVGGVVSPVFGKMVLRRE